MPKGYDQTQDMRDGARNGIEVVVCIGCMLLW